MRQQQFQAKTKKEWAEKLIANIKKKSGNPEKFIKMLYISKHISKYDYEYLCRIINESPEDK